MFILSLGAGIFLTALVCDGIIPLKMSRHNLISAFGILTCACTPFILLPGIASSAALVLCGLCGGALIPAVAAIFGQYAHIHSCTVRPHKTGNAGVYLTKSTVKQHITKILKKTGMENRVQLIKIVDEK